MSENDETAREFTTYAVGLCNASVCTSLSDDEATARLNPTHPLQLLGEPMATPTLSDSDETPDRVAQMENEHDMRPWWRAVDAAVREHPAWVPQDEYVYDDIVTFVERALRRDAQRSRLAEAVDRLAGAIPPADVDRGTVAVYTADLRTVTEALSGYVTAVEAQDEKPHAGEPA